jgi:hypothetical protein
MTLGSSVANLMGADCGMLSSQLIADSGRSVTVFPAKVVLAQVAAINTA